MSKNLKLLLGIFYLTILVIFLYFLFTNLDLQRLDDFTYYKELQSNIDKIVGKNFYFNIMLFFIFTFIWVSLLGFGTPILLMSGIFFGKWFGTIISVISISFGALFLYIIASYFFAESVKNLLNRKFSKYVELFKKNEFLYFLIFRLTGGFSIPFGLQNILPVIFNINKKNYFFGSMLGFVPVFFIWNTIGSGLSEYIKLSDEFSLINLILNKEIYTPIILFVFILCLSFFIRKKIFDNGRN